MCNTTEGHIGTNSLQRQNWNWDKGEEQRRVSGTCEIEHVRTLQIAHASSSDNPIMEDIKK